MEMTIFIIIVDAPDQTTRVRLELTTLRVQVNKKKSVAYLITDYTFTMFKSCFMCGY